MNRLQGRVAPVTGGGRGIGRGIALAFAREGASVAVSSRTLEELAAVVAEMAAPGAEGIAVKADAMSLIDAEACIETAVRSFGPIDILVPNPVSAQRASRQALLHMLAQKYGRIINIGSGYAKIGGGLPV